MEKTLKGEKDMKATHGTAIYTGGGIYIVIGELDNGFWFCGDNFGCAVYDQDTRTYNQEDDDLACLWADWCEQHEIKDMDQKEINKMFKDFCKRLDNQEGGITEGYEEFSNYAPGEVANHIDF